MKSVSSPILFLVILVTLAGCRTPRTADVVGPSVAPVIAEAKPITQPDIKTETPTPTPVPVPAPPEELPTSPAGELRLPGVFSDNMVLQQGMSVPIWGSAAQDGKVTVTFRDQKVSAATKNGKWIVKLRNLKPGGPDILKISGKTTIQFTNVLVGEVWLCSGQSNMEWPLKKSFQPQADITSATNNRIRLFMVPNVKADAPKDDIQAKWEVCTPDTAASFSAVAYYFGRDLQDTRQVPIGLIQSDWGGSPAETWMTRELLENNARYKAEILDVYAAAEKSYQEALVAYEKEKEEAKNKSEFKKTPPSKPWRPSELYNGMIAPLVSYGIKGVIWYQGESNASRGYQYRSLFADLIRNWRSLWGQGDFPFLCVQLAPFKPIKSQPGDSEWAELRDAQLYVSRNMPRVGLAVITDVGDEHDIHPTKKVPVGARLALAARGIAYEEKIVYSGPTYKNIRFEDNKAIIAFNHVGSGLEARGGALKGFSVAGSDGRFVWAIAEIQPDDTVVVSSPNVPNPVAVRFGWADYPVVNLWNKEGLPASPFRTDDFPLSTDPRIRKANEEKTAARN